MSESAHIAWRWSCGCLFEDGDHDRQRRRQISFEPVQSVVWLIGDTTSRVPGRDGLKGKRVGEASNPGPADDQMASTVDDSMGIESALEFDLTQLDSDHGVSGSETESCAEEPPVGRNAHRDRRLRLTWAQEWHPDARAAECVMRELAARIGHVPPEAPVPRAIRQQRWSPMNVPLMWRQPACPRQHPCCMQLLTGIRDS